MLGIRNDVILESEIFEFHLSASWLRSVCVQFFISNISLRLFSAGLSNRNAEDPETFDLLAEGSSF